MSVKIMTPQEQSIGGFIIPEVAYVDVPKDGFIYKAIRFLGDSLIKSGAFIKQLGYSKKEIRPQESLMKWIKENEKVSQK